MLQGHQQALDAGLGTWDADSWWAPDKGAVTQQLQLLLRCTIPA